MKTMKTNVTNNVTANVAMKLVKEVSYQTPSFEFIGRINELEEEIPYLYCGICNKKTELSQLSFDDYVRCEHCQNEVNRCKLTFGKTNFVKSVKVYSDGEKYSVSWLTLTMGANRTSRNIYCQKTTDRLVFNKKTGLTYLLPTWTDGKLDSKCWHKHIMNITNNYVNQYNVFPSVPDEIIEFLWEELVGRISENFGHNITALKLANRYPWLTDEQIRVLMFGVLNPIGRIESDKKWCKLSSYMKGIKRNDTPTIVVKTLMKNIGMEDTNGNKKLLKGEGLVKYPIIKELGFADINCIRTVMNSANADFLQSIYTNNTAIFSKALIENKKESVVSKIIADMALKYEDWLDDKRGNFVDASNYWVKLKMAGKADISFLKGNLKEICAKLENEYEKIKSEIENLPFEYSEKDKILEHVFDNGYTISLAVNKAELVDVTDKMRICVGKERYGFIEEIRSKRIYIFLLKDENNKYINCIEVTRKNKVMNQCKAFANGKPNTMQSKMVFEWAEKHNIDTDSCNDLGGVRNLVLNHNNNDYDELDQLLPF